MTEIYRLPPSGLTGDTLIKVFECLMKRSLVNVSQYIVWCTDCNSCATSRTVPEAEVRRCYNKLRKFSVDKTGARIPIKVPHLAYRCISRTVTHLQYCLFTNKLRLLVFCPLPLPSQHVHIGELGNCPERHFSEGCKMWAKWEKICGRLSEDWNVSKWPELSDWEQRKQLKKQVSKKNKTKGFSIKMCWTLLWSLDMKMFLQLNMKMFLQVQVEGPQM